MGLLLSVWKPDHPSYLFLSVHCAFPMLPVRLLLSSTALPELPPTCPAQRNQCPSCSLVGLGLVYFSLKKDGHPLSLEAEFREPGNTIQEPVRC